MEILQMLKFSLKHGRELNFTAGTSQDDIEMFLSSEAAAIPVSSDINAYIQCLVAQSPL